MSGRNVPSWQHVFAEGGDLKLANIVTLSRAALIVPIFALLSVHMIIAALLLSVLAAATDLVDGWLARRQRRASRFGAQLDAVVDNVFSLAVLGFLMLAYPGIVARHPSAVIVLFGGPLAYLGLSYALRKRALMFHFWSAKAGAFLLFCLWPLIAVTQSEVWLPTVAAIVGFSRLEQLFFLLRGGADLNAPHGLAKITHEQGMSEPVT